MKAAAAGGCQSRQRGGGAPGVPGTSSRPRGAGWGACGGACASRGGREASRSLQALFAVPVGTGNEPVISVSQSGEWPKLIFCIVFAS